MDSKKYGRGGTGEGGCLVRWLARNWSAVSAPPPVPLPGPRALPSYARMGRYIAGGAALDPRVAAGASSTAFIGGARRFSRSLSSGRCDATPRARSSPRAGTGARALARFGPARRLDPAVAVHAALGGGPDRRKIGRASCRERGETQRDA